MEMLKTIDISAIRPNPFQSRGAMDKDRLKELAEEIKENGFWEGALRAREVNGHYELIFGHRRLAALRMLKRQSIHVDVVNADDLQMAQESMIENLQREGLTDPEIAEALGAARTLEKSLADREFLKKYHDLLGISESRLSELLEMANLKDVATKQAVAQAKMKSRTVRMLKSISEDQGEEVIKGIASAGGMSMDAVQDIAKALKKAPLKTRRTVAQKMAKGWKPKVETVRGMVRRDAAERTEGGQRKKPDYDLMVYITEWTWQLEALAEKLEKAKPYAWYLTDTKVNTEITRKFENALKVFVKVAHELVEF